jgi:cell division septation protein DedD
MKFSADDFKHLYAEMPDEELRSLVRTELSDVARPCYDAELARRGLSSAPPRRTIQPVAPAEEPAEIAPESEERLEEAAEQEEEEDLVPAAGFTSRDEAKAAKALLQSAAIPAFLEDDTLAGGGFRLLVAASYVDRAREALAEAQ